MNTNIEQSAISELFLQSSDDYEPYGCASECFYEQETISSEKLYDQEISELVF